MRRIALATLLLFGCAPPQAGGDRGHGRDDTASALEVGPLDASQPIDAGASLAFRVEGYGATALVLDAAGAQLTVEGPAGVLAQAADHLDVTLGEGVHRVIVDADGATTLTS